MIMLVPGPLMRSFDDGLPAALAGDVERSDVKRARMLAIVIAGPA
jgi:hypothetical protein